MSKWLYEINYSDISAKTAKFVMKAFELRLIVESMRTIYNRFVVLWQLRKYSEKLVQCIVQ